MTLKLLSATSTAQLLSRSFTPTNLAKLPVEFTSWIVVLARSRNCKRLCCCLITKSIDALNWQLTSRSVPAWRWWYTGPVVVGNVGDNSVGHLKHNSSLTPHASAICVGLLGDSRHLMTGRLATHPSNTTVERYTRWLHSAASTRWHEVIHTGTTDEVHDSDGQRTQTCQSNYNAILTNNIT